MKQSRLSAIVLAYGDDGTLQRSLEALRVALRRVPATTELIVVLNRVTEKTRVELRRWADVNVLDPGRNLGFAGGVNAALEWASGDWIALVNDDCIVEPLALAELLTAGESDSEVGSVAAQVRFADRTTTINSAGIEIDVLGIATERLLGAPISASEVTVTNVFGASATACLYRRRMLDDIGGLDESFFAYLEDADVAWRARMAGWRCVYAPASIAHHHHSASLGHGSAAKAYLVGRNRVRLLARNATARQLIRYGPAIVLYDMAYIMFAGLQTKSLAPLKGRVVGLRNWREDRAAANRSAVDLARARGIHSALRRHYAYLGR